jgi:hypothetical protein
MVLCMDCHLVNIIILVPYFHFIHHGMKNGSIVDLVVSSSNHIGEDVLSSYLIFFLSYLYMFCMCFKHTTSIHKISIIKSWDAKFMVYKMNFYFSFIQIYDIMNTSFIFFFKSWTFKNQCQ